MRYSKLISKKNLELAWRRITTGRNTQYKRFFRPIYYAYEVSFEENLHRLRDELKGDWKPQTPERIYIPKPTGLQRPITLLLVDDQIVLQAIANIFSINLYEKRKNVERTGVFSNILNSPIESKFFVRDWHETYHLFQEKCVNYFEDGYRWISHFDLSAFYDTISHNELIRRIAPKGGYQSTTRRIKKWLKVWTSIDTNKFIDHGIPQGPIASDFLAECFLLPLDEALLNEDLRYVRYVDDIRIFSKTRFEAQKASILLEVYCRELGLIPQGRKFSINEAKSPDDVLGIMPSLAPPDHIESVEPVEISSKEAEKTFKKAISGRPYVISDKSIARFVLFRAPKSRKLLRWVLLLIPRHPEHIDAFVHYLSNYSKSKPIVRKLNEMLIKGTPYEYVRGEVWQVLARIGPKQVFELLLPMALKESRKENSFAQKWGALAFLLKAQELSLGRYAYRLKFHSPIVQALLVEKIPDEEYTRKVIIPYLLTSSNYEPGIMLAEQLIRRKKDLTDYDVRVEDLHPITQKVFRALEIIPKEKAQTVDQIAIILRRRYQIDRINKWRNVLRGEYVYALKLLLQAEAVYDAGRTQWLLFQNSFNDALLRAFINFLDESNLPGVMKLVGRDGRNVKFGVLLDKKQNFSLNYPIISRGFRKANERRNTLPGSHPYAEKGGSRNKYLSRSEQIELKGFLSASYSEIIDFVDNNS